MQIKDIQDDIDEELISHDALERRIVDVAAAVSRDYKGKNPLLIAVLKGAANVMVTFSQAMSIPLEIDYMSLSSYGSGTESSGKITVREDLTTDVAGRHVLIVEDIVDSGYTLNWLVGELNRRGAASVEIFAMLEKHAGNIMLMLNTGGLRSPINLLWDMAWIITSITVTLIP